MEWQAVSVLQWGRAVTRGTGARRKPGSHVCLDASMGPRSYARNGFEDASFAIDTIAASMGPRSYARNGLAAASGVPEFLEASMGPRSYARNGE